MAISADDAATGHPWAPTGKGTGHVWPALSSERGEQQLQTGDAVGAAGILNAMANFASGVGLIPEQDWTLPDLAASPFGTDPTLASIGFVNGKAAGSASPLVWSAGSFVRLFRDIGAGQILNVVEAGRQEARDKIAKGADIERNEGQRFWPRR
jgi:hypothetical protein